MKRNLVLSAAIALSVAALTANAEGTGPFGYPNLLVNPDFENATIADNSNNGKWGWFKNGKVSLLGWTGVGNAGVAAESDNLWLPWVPEDDNYRAFIQMQKGFTDDTSWIEQTVSVETSGNYAFSCRYATRFRYNPNANMLGISVVSDGVTNELETISLQENDCKYKTAIYYLTLEAGKSYTFRLHGVAETDEEADVDRTAIIGNCALEFLPSADRTIGADIHLTADEDWSNVTVDIAPGTKVFLDGHSLKIGQVRSTGDGEPPAFFDDTETPGELRVTVPEGQTLANCGWSVLGGAALVKDGPGTFVWRGGTVAEESPILVTDGVFRIDTASNNLFGAGGTFTIRDTGQFDIHFAYQNMTSPVIDRTFYIEGDGPDGLGAIVNNAQSHFQAGAGFHLKRVVLTGDATFGGISRIDFRGTDVALNGENFNLIIKNTAKVAFCDGEAHLYCNNVILTSGGVLEPCNDGGIMHITGTVFIDHGGVLSSWAKGNTQDLYFPIIVGEGGGAVLSSAYWYRITGPITVESGNTLDCPTSGPWYNGAITNNTDSTINIGGDFFATGGIFKNDGTVVQTAGKLYFGSRDDQNHPCRLENNGTIRTTGGSFYFRSENRAYGSGVFDLGGSTSTLAGDFSDFTGTIRISGGTASFESVSTFSGTLVMAGGAVSTSLGSVTAPVIFDLSERTSSFMLDGSGWTTLPLNTPVTINLQGRDLAVGDKLLSWKSVPLLAFSLDEETAKAGVALVSTPIGLYYGISKTDAIYATWTNAAGNGDYGDARNWVCLDYENDVIENGLPSYETIVTLAADVPIGGWETFLSNEQVGPIHLGGHRLVIHGADGDTTAFSISDASVDTSHPGEVRFTLGTGTNFVKTANLSLVGNISLVIDGDGMFVWNSGALDASVPITVSGGIFKLGVETSDVFGASGTITVNGTGQFDINYGASGGSSPVRKKTFNIEGHGPDGSGALVNNASVGNWGYHLNRVVMTGDATIGGTSRIDFRGNNLGIDGAGHTLTIKNTGMLAFCGGTAYLNCKDVIASDGGIFQPCSGCVLGITGNVILENGGVFASWSGRNVTQEFKTSVIVGEGGGTIRSDNYWYKISAPITVESGNVLECPNDAPWYNGAITNNLGSTINIGGDFFASGRIFVNDGTVTHTGGNLYFGSRDDANSPCRVENNGTIRTSDGNFYFKSESSAHGTGVFELAGGTPSMAGNFSDFMGTILLTGGTAAIDSINTFPGTLLLRDGMLSTALAGFPGTAIIDLTDRELPYDIEGKNWITFSNGKTVIVEVGDRVFNNGDQIISWESCPANANKIRFELSNGQRGALAAKEDGLFYYSGMMFMVR